jgi:hypothetical protein
MPQKVLSMGSSPHSLLASTWFRAPCCFQSASFQLVSCSYLLVSDGRFLCMAFDTYIGKVGMGDNPPALPPSTFAQRLCQALPSSSTTVALSALENHEVALLVQYFPTWQYGKHIQPAWIRQDPILLPTFALTLEYMTITQLSSRMCGANATPRGKKSG